MTADLRQDALAVTFPGFEGRTAPSWVLDALAEGMSGVFLFSRNVSSSRTVSSGHHVTSGVTSRPSGRKVDSSSTRALCDQLRAARPDALICIDEEGGDVTRLEATVGSRFPGNAALGAVDEPALTMAVASEIADLLREKGINLNAAPVADVNSADANPVIGVRSFGADPELVARHTAAYIQGCQSRAVAATVKHFPGHGATVADSHLELPTVDADEATLRRRDLAPFRAAISAGVSMVMTAHLSAPALDATPATLSRRILTDLLRDELGFEGVIMTDGLDMHAISRGVGRDEGGVQAIIAGADALCVGGESVTAADLESVVGALVAAVEGGRLPRQRLAEAAQRVRRLAAWADPRRATPSIQPDDEQSRLAARRALCIVGDVRVGAAPLVLELLDEATVAIGEVPWGIGEHVAALMPGTVVRQAHRGTPIDLADVADRSLVVCVRDTWHRPWQREVLREARAQRPDLVVVDCGWPSAPDLLGERYVVTWGASAVSARAAARVLAAPSMEMP